jgi:hypothetical protein
MDGRRSRETRARGELALVWLLCELRDDDVFLVMLGGLVPELLASDDDLIPEHLGTTDVGILLITHVEPDADLGGVERALNRMNLEPDPTEDGWRWRGPVEDCQVKLEFPCDLSHHREGEMLRPRGCTNSPPRTFAAPATLLGTSYGRSCQARSPMALKSGYGRASPGLRATCCRSAWQSAPAPPPSTTTTLSTCFCITARRPRTGSAASARRRARRRSRSVAHDLSRDTGAPPDDDRQRAGRICPSRQSTLSRKLTRRC